MVSDLKTFSHKACKIATQKKKKKSANFALVAGFFWYQCYDPHRSRDSLSPKYGIFLADFVHTQIPGHQWPEESCKISPCTLFFIALLPEGLQIEFTCFSSTCFFKKFKNLKFLKFFAILSSFVTFLLHVTCDILIMTCDTLGGWIWYLEK